MKKLVLLFYLLFFTFHFSFSQGVWTWVKGDSIANTSGIYGTQGVPAPQNIPPGTYEPCEWTDQQGNFWIFGGGPGSSYYADLWKYNPLTNEWTWVNGNKQFNDPGNYGIKGVPALTNRPPARGYGSASWVDQNGDLWVYGGMGISSAGKSDMWRYNIATNTWTWMNGPTTSAGKALYGKKGVPSANTTPGNRWECSANWVDASGNFWLFGGFSNGPVFGTFSDMWKYSPVTNQWTWMSGDSTVNGLAIHGTKGVFSPANTPGARAAYCTWKGLNGTFWFFGGRYYPANSYFNDMWQYNTVTNEWAWMNGPNTPSDSGKYGPYCMSGANYFPQARYENRARWTDACGRFWLYGGQGTFAGRMNDLWCFNSSTLEWTLVSGGKKSNAPGRYNKIGIPSLNNDPGGRGGCISWLSNNGDAYVFGGSFTVYRNDIWRYQPDSACPVSGTSITLNLGKDTAYCGSFSKVLSTGNSGTLWSTGITAAQITVTTPGKFWATALSCGATVSDTITLSQNPLPVAGNISSNKDSICAGTALTSTFSAAGSVGNIQWQESTDSITFTNIAGATNTTYTTPPGLSQTKYYRAIATTGGGCPPDTTAISVLHIIPSPSASFVDTVTGKVVKFTSTTGGNVIYYTWDFGDSTSSTVVNPTHTYTRADTFNVCLTVYNASNCSFTFCKDVITTLGTGIETHANSLLRVYPNPTRDKLIVESYSSLISRLEITDVLGTNLLVKDIADSHREVVDVSHLPPGIYLLRVTCGGQSSTFKVVHY